MDWKDDIEFIRGNLSRKEAERKTFLEKMRLQTKAAVILKLQAYFRKLSGCNVWLFGSIMHPYAFTSQSDIDIAVSGFPGSRLDLFPELEQLLQRQIDLVMMEKSQIREIIEEFGEKIV